MARIPRLARMRISLVVTADSFERFDGAVVPTGSARSRLTIKRVRKVSSTITPATDRRHQGRGAMPGGGKKPAGAVQALASRRAGSSSLTSSGVFRPAAITMAVAEAAGEVSSSGKVSANGHLWPKRIDGVRGILNPIAPWSLKGKVGHVGGAQANDNQQQVRATHVADGAVELVVQAVKCKVLGPSRRSAIPTGFFRRRTPPADERTCRRPAPPACRPSRKPCCSRADLAQQSSAWSELTSSELVQVEGKHRCRLLRPAWRCAICRRYRTAAAGQPRSIHRGSFAPYTGARGFARSTRFHRRNRVTGCHVA